MSKSTELNISDAFLNAATEFVDRTLASINTSGVKGSLRLVWKALGTSCFQWMIGSDQTNKGLFLHLSMDDDRANFRWQVGLLSEGDLMKGWIASVEATNPKTIKTPLSEDGNFAVSEADEEKIRSMMRERTLTFQLLRVAI